MKINGLNLFQCRTPFVLPFESPHLKRSAAESVLVELVFDLGRLSGWGESSPRFYVTGETVESVCRLFQEIFAPRLFEAKIESTEAAAVLLQQIEDDCQAKGIRAYLSALGACDLALLDALGEKNAVPLTGLLGPTLRSDIPRSLSIPLLPISKLAGFVQTVRNLKIMDFKVLMQSNPEENRRRVEWVREAIDPFVRIRIEANGKWPLNEALRQIRYLKDTGICGVEQPVAAGDLAGLRTIREETGLPVIADESLCSYHQAEALIEAGACDIMNIKISKCGGLLRSRRIADLAHRHGLACQIGTHVGETPLLASAGDSFAITAPGVTLYENGSPLLFGAQMKTGKLGTSNGNKWGLGAEVIKEELVQVGALHAPSARTVRRG